MIGKRAGAPRLDRDLVAVAELAHVQLAGRGALARAVRAPVDHHPARAADALAAVVVERDRLLAVGDEPLVDDVEHLEERHVGADAGRVEVSNAPGASGPAWRQTRSVRSMLLSGSSSPTCSCAGREVDVLELELLLVERRRRCRRP